MKEEKKERALIPLYFFLTQSILSFMTSQYIFAFTAKENQKRSKENRVRI